MAQVLKAPFPWFGGKSRVAAEVWRAFGEVPNYVEPFFGSGAVLLGRPHKAKTETINDKDGYVANFWRAVKHDPEAVAAFADNPVNENDLHARHAWLVTHGADLPRLLEGDPWYYHPQIAGWWVWGMACWIGSSFCEGKGPWHITEGQLLRINAGRGIKRKIPHLGDAGRGIQRKIPHLGDAGQGIQRQIDGEPTRREWIAAWFQDLADRMRETRVCCGDWSRVMGQSVTFKHGLTGVFLDPPYSEKAGRETVYSVEDFSVAHDVREWCKENGDNPKLRIALCGYDGEHNELEALGWRVHTWKASNGFQSSNGHKERIWFSPHCLHVDSQLDIVV